MRPRSARFSLLRLPAFLALAFAFAACNALDDYPPETDRGPVVAVVGDSITSGFPLWDPSRLRRLTALGKADPRSQFVYWAERRLGDRARFRNCGKPGRTTAQLEAPLERCSKGAEAVIIQAGGNDLALGATPAQVARNLGFAVRSAKRRGLEVVLTDVTPISTVPAQVALLNSIIRRLGRDERVPVLGFHAALADPDHPESMRPEYDIGDHVHPSIAGHRRLGALIQAP